MSLIRKIKDYYKRSKTTLFTTPSHSQGEFIPPLAKIFLGEKFYKCDFSEIEGFDDLREPKTILKELQNKISKIYEAKSSFMLTNGSTSGILAAMLSTLKENDNVLIARNCHVSVYNGLVLTGAKPIWFMPEYDRYWGIYKGIEANTVEKLLNEHQNIKALIITSPTYEGVFSDIKKISNICKQKGVFLIVDEAHGAILNFSENKEKSALQQNADLVIHSLHKTAGAPNPCALLHVSKSSKISTNEVQNALNIINTTSPSYPLMVAIETTVLYLNSKRGRQKVQKLYKEVENFLKSLPEDIEYYIGNNDKTKILLKSTNINACAFADILNQKYKIEEEYSTPQAMLFITGIGTNNQKLNKLCCAIKKIAADKKLLKAKSKESQLLQLPTVKYTPRQAYFMESNLIDKQNSLNKVSGECITQYPPGIPLILPGEIITQDIINNIAKKKIKVI